MAFDLLRANRSYLNSISSWCSDFSPPESTPKTFLKPYMLSCRTKDAMFECL